MSGKGRACCDSGCGCTSAREEQDSSGCGCGEGKGERADGGRLSRHQKVMLVRMALTVAMLAGLQLVPAVGLVKFFLYLVPYLVMGYDILLEALEGIRRRQVFDVNFLMAVATLGALAIGLSSTGDYNEAVAVMLFYQLGEWFEGFAVARSRRNITQLMDIRPDYANVLVDGSLCQVLPESLEVGSVVVVQPGERIPLDGVIEEGSSSLDTVALTGESLPRDVAAGDSVVSGCINLSGRLTVRTTRLFSQSTVAKILDLVEQAGERKSRPEAFITKFARIYTPIVCYGALALFLLPPAVEFFLLKTSPQWGLWLYRSLTFLVISCPCALVISIPLTFFAGIGGASREGILIKGSNFMESLSRIRTVVFDKTGTLTQGSFRVVAVSPNPYASKPLTEAQLLELAALIECNSVHPISKSILAAYGREPDRSRVAEVRERAGLGLVATVDGRRVVAGNTKLMAAEGIALTEGEAPAGGETSVHLSVDGSYGGRIILADSLKPTAEQAIAQLRRLGIRKTVLLTGDTAAVAESVAGQLDIDRVESQLLPGDKVARVEELLAAQENGGKLAFVGDGINDAPVLSRSDVGIAMGGLGSDAAIEAADVVLMDDNLMKLPKAIRISRKTLGIAGQNIAFALGVKFACMVLGVLGYTTMWLAIFADVGVMLLAVLNAIRALSVSKL